MSPIPRPRPPSRRVLLERLSRPLLARFLSTHAADFCAAHGLSLEALAASAPHDRTLVHRLFDLLQLELEPLFPDAALHLLAVLEALATPRGGERLIELDTRRVLPGTTLGDEDLALTALLDHPELAHQAHALLPAEPGDPIDGFTEYDPTEPRPFRFGAAEKASLETLFGDELEARSRDRHCSVQTTREAKRLLLEIEYCRRPKTRDRLDVAARTVAPATDTNTERAYAEIDRPTGRLALHAPHPAMKEILRKLLGKVLAGNDAHFTAARVYDLSPFRELETALVNLVHASSLAVANRAEGDRTHVTGTA